MEFDVSRVYTAVNAGSLNTGDLCFFADDLATLKRDVEKGTRAGVLRRFCGEQHCCCFECSSGVRYALVYKLDAETLVELQEFQSQHSIYNRKNGSQAQNDVQIVTLLKKLPKKILLRRGNKAKANILRQRFAVVVNHKRIEHMCRIYGLLAKNRRKKFPKHYYEQRKQNKQHLAENILNRQFCAAEPLKKLCTDVSYLRTAKGWLYVSAVLDLYRRQIIAYHVSTHNDAKLVMAMLDKLPCLAHGVLLHSVQGSVYASKSYKNHLREKKIIQSMSRRANCWDNACMEHFFGTLKVESGYNELIKIRTPEEKEVRALINNFITYYNN